MIYEVKEKTAIELKPGEIQTRCLIQRLEPLKYLAWNLPGDWSNRTDEEIVNEILELDYRLSYGNRAEEEERKRVNTLLKGYEQQLKEANELVDETRKTVGGVSTHMPLLQADVDLLYDVIPGIAKLVGYQLPEEFDTEEDSESAGHEPDGHTDTDEKGDEHHGTTEEANPVGDSETGHASEGGETHAVQN